MQQLAIEKSPPAPRPLRGQKDSPFVRVCLARALGYLKRQPAAAIAAAMWPDDRVTRAITEPPTGIAEAEGLAQTEIGALTRPSGGVQGLEDFVLETAAPVMGRAQRRGPGHRRVRGIAPRRFLRAHPEPGPFSLSGGTALASAS